MSDRNTRGASSSRHPQAVKSLADVKIPRREASQVVEDQREEGGRRKKTTRGDEVPESDLTIQIPSHLDADKRKPARCVTKNDPYRTNYSKKKMYANTNSLGDHRYHRHTQAEAAPSRTPISVEDYIKLCAEDNIRDGKRFQAISNAPTVSRNGQGEAVNGEPKRARSWRTQWRHMGARALKCRAVQPCDYIWLRCPEEKEYQELLVESNTVMTARTEKYDRLEDVPSCLPRPITNWYMLGEREYWEDDIIYEDRMRNKNFNPSTEPGAEKIGLMISWHWINMHDIPSNQRYKLFYRTPEAIKEIELSPVVPTPSSPMAIYAEHLTTWNYDVQDMFLARILKEQVEINFSSFVKAASDGLIASRLDDPRITSSGKYGILVEIPKQLYWKAGNSMIVDLFYGSDYELERIRLAVDRSGIVDWKELAKTMTHPFVWYDFENSKVIDLPKREELEYHIVGDKVLSWCVRVYPEVRVPFLPPTERQPASYQFAQEEIRSGMKQMGMMQESQEEEDPPDRPDEHMEIEYEGDVRETEEMEEMRQDLMDDRGGTYQQMEQVFSFFHSDGSFSLPENIDKLFKEYCALKKKEKHVDVEGPKMVALKEKVKRLEQDKDILNSQVTKLANEKETLNTDVIRLQRELAESRSDTARITVENSSLKKRADVLNDVLTESSKTIFLLTASTESDARRLADNMKNIREKHQQVLKHNLGRTVEVSEPKTMSRTERQFHGTEQVTVTQTTQANPSSIVPTGVPIAVVETNREGSNPTVLAVGQVEATMPRTPATPTSNPSRSHARRNIRPNRNDDRNRAAQGEPGNP